MARKIFNTLIAIRLDIKTLEKIDSYAKKHRISRSEAIRRLVLEALRERTS
jgi:Ribbon-helix-helix protein, copG family.